MDAILVFLVFGIALVAVYVQHYCDVSIANLITWLSMAVTVAAVASFIWYPYQTVPFDERVQHVYLCIGLIIGSLITMAIAAYIDATKS